MKTIKWRRFLVEDKKGIKEFSGMTAGADDDEINAQEGDVAILFSPKKMFHIIEMSNGKYRVEVMNKSIKDATIEQCVALLETEMGEKVN